jgi:hypothetical protein
MRYAGPSQALLKADDASFGVRSVMHVYQRGGKEASMVGWFLDFIFPCVVRK